MTMLAERVDAVIGVDTHTDTHTAVICDARGGVLAIVTVVTDEAGYGELLDAALTHAPGPRVAWAIEGTGSYGAGLTAALAEWDQEVIEVRAVKRVRGQAKNDTKDALSAARTALAAEAHHAEPRTGQVREALRLITLSRNANVKTRTRLINAFKAVVLTAPADIRDRLRDRSTAEQIRTASRLRRPAHADPATTACIHLLKQTAAQITTLNTLIKDAEKQLDTLTSTHAAPLRAELGVGPVSAAQLLITWSHPGRFRNEAAFAAIAGTSPLEASSGRTVRHRLNRTGDRQLNAAIHRVVLTRRAHHHPDTTAYIERRTTDGKTPKEIERFLKRYLSRRLFRLLENMPAMP
jgi:transposase